MSDNPSFTKLEATTRFIETVYGKWINENTGTDYTFENITTSDFVINFTYDDDAHLFIQKIGGRILED